MSLQVTVMIAHGRIQSLQEEKWPNYRGKKCFKLEFDTILIHSIKGRVSGLGKFYSRDWVIFFLFFNLII